MEPGNNTVDEFLAALLRAWLVTFVASLAVAGTILLVSCSSRYPAGPSWGEMLSDLSEAGAL